MIRCNGNWEKFNDTLKSEVLSFGKKIKYQSLEESIQKASKVVITKCHKIPKKPTIFGCNKIIKEEIKKRRMLCSLWKKEKGLFEESSKRKRISDTKRKSE